MVDINSGILPAEFASYHSLILTVVGTVGTIALAELIKEKNEVPVKTMATWAGIFAISMVASVYFISKHSK